VDPDDPNLFRDRCDRAYTKYALIYDALVKLLPGWKTWLQRALPHIEGSRVLEVSFGTGYLLTRYAGRHETHGVDYNRRMVAVARSNLARRGLSADLRQGDVAYLPYDDAYFNTVVNTMALSGYPDATRALAEMWRVLRPGGRLVLIDINYPKNQNWLGVALTRFWQRLGDIIRDLDSLLSASGFAYEDTEIGGFGSVHMYLCKKLETDA
jgi:ubiquinone/menaquinone biosynthesis C-methylase UbiE